MTLEQSMLGGIGHWQLEVDAFRNWVVHPIRDARLGLVRRRKLELCAQEVCARMTGRVPKR
ncbi:hypothetical protein [Amycolatopsis pithecellobii]|uniref:Uncharacterized protein n=1 Tax=Amycolatopsis pithecellobii TaxID=664692 RepID=A0A6N7ZD51_9PSEU|nr:hypothetical protein [Amycolatopsis pithecellobii]MTD59668.1 hypothetical protein [Amycolatopsis pithecellobii]